MVDSNCSTCPHKQNCKKSCEISEQKNEINNIKNKILIMSGKGGVGKSTVAVNLAVALSLAGYKAGLLDIDLHGPSIPKILGLEERKTELMNDLLQPVEYNENLKVLSIGFFLPEEATALIWRGPVKQKIITQFVNDANWGELDYLIVDCPPGTGDEPLSIVQTLESLTGAIIITTPQQLAISDVKKSVKFCRELDIPILGIIENMSGYILPDSNKIIDIFKSGGGENMAKEMDIPFLGKIPLDPEIVEACDNGKPFIDVYSEGKAAKIFNEAIIPIMEIGQEYPWSISA